MDAHPPSTHHAHNVLLPEQKTEAVALFSLLLVMSRLLELGVSSSYNHIPLQSLQGAFPVHSHKYALCQRAPGDQGPKRVEKPVNWSKPASTQQCEASLSRRWIFA